LTKKRERGQHQNQNELHRASVWHLRFQLQVARNISALDEPGVRSQHTV
jgi:hypothetical protein